MEIKEQEWSGVDWSGEERRGEERRKKILFDKD